MRLRGSISPTVCPAGWLVVFGGREPVAEGDGECVQDGLPPHGPSHLAIPGGVKGPGDQVQARDLPVCVGVAGSCTVTWSPPSVRGVMVSVPSCAWVMLLTIARPRPPPASSVRMRWVPRSNGSLSFQPHSGLTYS